MLNAVATVDVYSIDTNSWKRCASLNNPRDSHASCTLGDKLYISGGHVNVDQMEDSIEVANCKELIAGAGSFTVITVCGFKGKYHVFCPISTHEILIMGGKYHSDFPILL